MYTFKYVDCIPVRKHISPNGEMYHFEKKTCVTGFMYLFFLL